MELRRQHNLQKDEMLRPNHNSAAECMLWGLSSSGCRSDQQVLSSCHGLDTPKQHCQVLAFLSFHAESSAQLRQRTVVFSLKSTHKKPKQKPKIPPQNLQSCQECQLSSSGECAGLRQNSRKHQAPVDTLHVCTHHSH